MITSPNFADKGIRMIDNEMLRRGEKEKPIMTVKKLNFNRTLNNLKNRRRLAEKKLILNIRDEGLIDKTLVNLKKTYICRGSPSGTRAKDKLMRDFRINKNTTINQAKQKF